MKGLSILPKSLFGIGILSTAGILLLALRIAITGKMLFGFLLWNVALALLPLVPAYLFRRKAKQGVLLMAIPWFFSWLLLFPNGPYLLTDFVHLHDRILVPLWFDASLLFCFVLSGFLATIVSLNWIHEGLNTLFSHGVSWIGIGLCIMVSGYGIYLGRVLRLNSWDIIFDSKKTILIGFYHLQNIQAIAMTITFSIVILAVYSVFKIFNSSDHETFIR